MLPRVRIGVRIEVTDRPGETDLGEYRHAPLRNWCKSRKYREREREGQTVT